MRVALTGASGFIGCYVAKQLREAGHDVTGLIRSTSRRDHIEPYIDRMIVGDQSDEHVWPDLLDGAECIVHNSVDWAALKNPDSHDRHVQSNLVGSLRLLEASEPIQFIFMSTIAVHHDMRPRWEGRIDEDHPLRPANAYGAYKAAVEAHLWAAHYGQGRHTCALRPCGVYGVDPNLSRSYGHSLIHKIRRGESIRKAGGGKFVHVEDVADAVLACVGNERAAGCAFNLVDCYARWADWARMACDLLGTDNEIDMSSPFEPRNVFVKDAVHELGLPLDRGHDGIREYLTELIEHVPVEQTAST